MNLFRFAVYLYLSVIEGKLHRGVIEESNTILYTLGFNRNLRVE